MWNRMSKSRFSISHRFKDLPRSKVTASLKVSPSIQSAVTRKLSYYQFTLDQKWTSMRCGVCCAQHHLLFKIWLLILMTLGDNQCFEICLCSVQSTPKWKFIWPTAKELIWSNWSCWAPKTDPVFLERLFQFFLFLLPVAHWFDLLKRLKIPSVINHGSVFLGCF